MGTIRTPLRVKLFVGMLSQELDLFGKCAELLCEKYGPLDLESGVLPWLHTDYYREEMGTELFRKFIFFRQPADPAILPAVKLFTNEMEREFSLETGGNSRRRINIDPGYVTEAKVVLATTKDFAHRVYIGSGIYAEATLRYSNRDHGFKAVEHTYPDYRGEDCLRLFQKVRERLRNDLRGDETGLA